MRSDIDTVLLDRVFQRIVDAAAGWTSCFGLARLALAVAVLSQTAVLAGNLQASDDPLQRLLSGAIGLLAFVAAEQAWSLIRRSERQARPGGLNLRRITLRWQRLAWLAVALWSSMAGLPRADMVGFALCGVSLAWVGLIYFVSCTPAPPPCPSQRRLALA